MLQVVPVEVGQQVQPGHEPGARRESDATSRRNCGSRKRRPRTSRIGQPAEVDTRNGIVKGRVSRIDPASANGTVGVDVILEANCRPARGPT